MPRIYKTPLFEKRHYEWMAKNVGGARVMFDSYTKWQVFAEVWANSLKYTNPNYNRDRFLAACISHARTMTTHDPDAELGSSEDNH